jgi:hypothetical protein
MQTTPDLGGEYSASGESDDDRAVLTSPSSSQFPPLSRVLTPDFPPPYFPPPLSHPGDVFPSLSSLPLNSALTSVLAFQDTFQSSVSQSVCSPDLQQSRTRDLDMKENLLMSALTTDIFCSVPEFLQARHLPGAGHPAAHHQLLLHHPRLWVSGHCGLTHRHLELPD